MQMDNGLKKMSHWLSITNEKLNYACKILALINWDTLWKSIDCILFKFSWNWGIDFFKIHYWSGFITKLCETVLLKWLLIILSTKNYFLSFHWITMNRNNLTLIIATLHWPMVCSVAKYVGLKGHKSSRSPLPECK